MKKTMTFTFNKSNAYDDMFLAVSQEVARGRGIDILKALLKSDYFKKSKLDYDNLIDEQQKLQQAYQTFIKILSKRSSSKGEELKLLDEAPTILDGLIKVLDKSNNLENSSLSLSTLLNEKIEEWNNNPQSKKRGDIITDSNAMTALNTFGDKYQKFKNNFLKHQETVNATNEAIRGDKEYYQIFFRDVTGGRGTERQDRLIQIARTDFERFEKQNPDLFEMSLKVQKNKKTIEGKFNEYNLKRDLDPSKVYQALINTIGNNGKKIESIDLLDRIYAVANIDGKQQAISTRNIAKVLMSKDLTESAPELYNAQQGGMGPGRRLEMLFDPQIRNSIAQGFARGTIRHENQLLEFFKTGKGGFNDVDLISLKHQIQTENLYGGAGGDVIYRQGENIIGGQLKAKTGSGSPWNGAKVNAIFQNEAFFFDFATRIQTYFDNSNNNKPIEKQAQEIAEKLGWTAINRHDDTTEDEVINAAQSLLSSEEELPQSFMDHISATVINEAEDWFLSEFSSSGDDGGYELYTDF